MKVTFEGKPDKIRKEMHEFLGYEFPTTDETDEEEADESNDEKKPLTNFVCQFCEKYDHRSEGWVRSHEKHCKSNPDRVPHPKEGKMPPWMKKKDDVQPSH